MWEPGYVSSQWVVVPYMLPVKAFATRNQVTIVPLGADQGIKTNSEQLNINQSTHSY